MNKIQNKIIKHNYSTNPKVRNKSTPILIIGFVFICSQQFSRISVVLRLLKMTPNKNSKKYVGLNNLFKQFFFQFCKALKIFHYL